MDPQYRYSNTLDIFFYARLVNTVKSFTKPNVYIVKGRTGIEIYNPHTNHSMGIYQVVLYTYNIANTTLQTLTSFLDQNRKEMAQECVEELTKLHFTLESRFLTLQAEWNCCSKMFHQDHVFVPLSLIDKSETQHPRCIFIKAQANRLFFVFSDVFNRSSPELEISHLSKDQINEEILKFDQNLTRAKNKKLQEILGPKHRLIFDERYTRSDTDFIQSNEFKDELTTHGYAVVVFDEQNLFYTDDIWIYNRDEKGKTIVIKTDWSGFQAQLVKLRTVNQSHPRLLNTSGQTS